MRYNRKKNLSTAELVELFSYCLTFQDAEEIIFNNAQSLKKYTQIGFFATLKRIIRQREIISEINTFSPFLFSVFSYRQAFYGAYPALFESFSRIGLTDETKVLLL